MDFRFAARTAYSDRISFIPIEKRRSFTGYMVKSSSMVLVMELRSFRSIF